MDHIPFIPDELSLMSAERLPPQVRLTWDRNRTVNYNGHEIQMNMYECTSCREVYKFEYGGKHLYCPCCGTKYKYQDDISV